MRHTLPFIYAAALGCTYQPQTTQTTPQVTVTLPDMPPTLDNTTPTRPTRPNTQTEPLDAEQKSLYILEQVVMRGSGEEHPCLTIEKEGGIELYVCADSFETSEAKTKPLTYNLDIPHERLLLTDEVPFGSLDYAVECMHSTCEPARMTDERRELFTELVDKIYTVLKARENKK